MFCKKREKQTFFFLQLLASGSDWEQISAPPPRMPQFPHREEQTLLCYTPCPTSLAGGVCGFQPSFCTTCQEDEP